MSSSSPLEIFKSHIVRKVGGKRRDYVKRCITGKQGRRGHRHKSTYGRTEKEWTRLCHKKT
jgi:hypothetical protein